MGGGWVWALWVFPQKGCPIFLGPKDNKLGAERVLAKHQHSFFSPGMMLGKKTDNGALNKWLELDHLMPQDFWGTGENFFKSRERGAFPLGRAGEALFASKKGISHSAIILNQIGPQTLDWTSHQ